MNRLVFSQLLVELNSNRAVFSDVLHFIDQAYNGHAVAFSNGSQHNTANSNQGSAKVLYFAQLNKLSKADTLSLFAEHYQAVLQNPAGQDHLNIRQFIKYGFAGLQFSGHALTCK
jgi:RIO-like serine/threonine protein kinase